MNNKESNHHPRPPCPLDLLLFQHDDEYYINNFFLLLDIFLTRGKYLLNQNDLFENINMSCHDDVNRSPPNCGCEAKGSLPKLST